MNDKSSYFHIMPQNNPTDAQFLKPYRCGNCEESFPSIFTYRQHSVLHLINKKKTEDAYKCESCTNFFKTAMELRLHTEDAHQIYVCKQCNMSFKKEIHLKNHHTRRHSKCISFKRSTAAEHVNHPFKCEKHDMVFSDLTTYRLHLKSHFSYSAYKKDEIVELQADDVVEINEDPEDEVSNVEVVSVVTLQNAKKRKLNKDTYNVYVCFLCNMEFSIVEACRSHIMDHVNGKNS